MGLRAEPPPPPLARQPVPWRPLSKTPFLKKGDNSHTERLDTGRASSASSSDAAAAHSGDPDDVDITANTLRR